VQVVTATITLVNEDSALDYVEFVLASGARIRLVGGSEQIKITKEHRPL
jgi:hypothetical protein